MRIKLKEIILIVLLTFNFDNLEANIDHFNEGLVFFKENKLNKAKFKFEQDLVFNPKSEKSYLYLSKIFKAQNKKEQEEQNLNAVLLINPKNEEATYNLAKLKLERSDFTESKKLIEKLLIFCKNYCQKSKKLKIEIENSQKN